MDKFNEVCIKDKMDKCVVICQNNISKYNINNINTKLISNLLIDYHGSKVYLYKLSRIIIENFNSLRISLFDRNVKKSVKKCIYLSKLDLNVTDDKDDLIVNLPLLTKDRKIKILKLIKNEIELSKISIRNIRREFKNKFRLLLKKKIISKDEEILFNNKLQKITEFYIKKLEVILINKKNTLFSN